MHDVLFLREQLYVSCQSADIFMFAPNVCTSRQKFLYKIVHNDHRHLIHPEENCHFDNNENGFSGIQIIRM